MIDPFHIVFAGESADQVRLARLALIRLRQGVLPTDPLARVPDQLLARDLPCSVRTAQRTLSLLERNGWLHEGEPEGRPVDERPLRRAERAIVRALAAEFGTENGWHQAQVTRDDSFLIVLGPEGIGLSVTVHVAEDD